MKKIKDIEFHTEYGNEFQNYQKCDICGQEKEKGDVYYQHDTLWDGWLECKECHTAKHQQQNKPMKKSTTYYEVVDVEKTLYDKDANKYKVPAFQVVEIDNTGRLVYELPMKYEDKKEAYKIADELNETTSQEKIVKKLDKLNPKEYYVEEVETSPSSGGYNVMEKDMKTGKARLVQNYGRKHNAIDKCKKLAEEMAEKAYEEGLETGMIERNARRLEESEKANKLLEAVEKKKKNKKNFEKARKIAEEELNSRPEKPDVLVRCIDSHGMEEHFEEGIEYLLKGKKNKDFWVVEDMLAKDIEVFAERFEPVLPEMPWKLDTKTMTMVYDKKVEKLENGEEVEIQMLDDGKDSKMVVNFVKNRGETICQLCKGKGKVMIPKMYPNGHREVMEDCEECMGEGTIYEDDDREEYTFDFDKVQGEILDAMAIPEAMMTDEQKKIKKSWEDLKDIPYLGNDVPGDCKTCENYDEIKNKCLVNDCLVTRCSKLEEFDDDEELDEDKEMESIWNDDDVKEYTQGQMEAVKKLQQTMDIMKGSGAWNPYTMKESEDIEETMDTLREVVSNFNIGDKEDE